MQSFVIKFWGASLFKGTKKCFLQSFEHEIESICTIMSIRGCNVLKNIKLNCYLQSFQKIREYCVCKIDELLKMSLALKNWRKLLKFLNRTWPTNSDKFTPWTISGGPSFSPIVSIKIEKVVDTDFHNGLVSSVDLLIMH